LAEVTEQMKSWPALFLLVLLARQAPGQRGDDKQRIGVFTVRLPVTVKVKDKFVAGLRANNFEIYEDGKRQRIDSFQAPSQLPLSIAILMDASESVKLKLPFEKDAAEDFVARVMDHRRRDQMLFATFNSDIELLQDFTDAQEPLIRAIRRVKAGGVTRLYDAVYRVIEEKMASLQGSEARRVILLLSDGADTASERSLEETIRMAQRYDVTIFGVSTKNFSGISSGLVEGEDDKELRRLCEETGGQLFLPSQKVELFRAFNRVAEDLRQEYIIYYTPDNQERTGKLRSIKVKLVGAEGKLYHKRGYVH
jgi:Ca-activated chloride channel family protein